MPFLAGIIPILTEIAPALTAVAAAGTLAATGYELANQPGGGPPTGQTQVQNQQLAQLQAQQNAQQKAAFVAAQPNVQAATGGGLTGTALNTATAQSAGVPSDLNSILKYLGQGTANQPTSANVSGGITQTPGTQNAQTSPYDLQSLTDLLQR